MHFDPRKILVIDFGQLGDVILSLPALRAVCDRFSEAKKTVLVGSACAEIVRMTNLFDEVIEVDRVRLLRGNKFYSSIEIIRFAAAIRRRKFDFVIDLHSLPETNLLGYVSGAGHRLFANRHGRSLDFLANFRPAPPAEDRSINLSLHYMRVLEPLGVSDSFEPIHLQPAKEDTDFVDASLQGAYEKLIGLNVGAGHPTRRWDISNFRELAEILLRRGNLRPVIILGPEETAMRDEVAATFPPRAIVLSSLTLPQLAALTSRLAAFVSSDTGPMHLAAVMGTPIVLLLHREAQPRFFPLAKRLITLKYEMIDDIAAKDAETALTRLGIDSTETGPV